MLYADFCWNCPSCKKMNWESFANEDDTYKCKECKRAFYLTFSVEVEEIEAYDEQSDTVSTVNMVELEISKDSGKTWENMPVDTRDLNPETSPLKAGWLIKHKEQTYRLYLHNSLNRLQTEKVTA